MLKFTFTNETNLKVSSIFFERLLDNAYKILAKRIDRLLKKRDGQINLILVDDKTIHGINKKYRHKDRPTDVISFAYLEAYDVKNLKKDLIVGDIFISADTAIKQAKEMNHSLKTELKTLFVHGILHLFGFDHNNDKEEAEMEKVASAIIKA